MEKSGLRWRGPKRPHYPGGPAIFPDSVTLKIVLPATARQATAQVCFDGKSPQVLYPGDAVLVTTSVWPLPAVCREDQHIDWFRSVKKKLLWNERAVQGNTSPSIKQVNGHRAWRAPNPRTETI